MTQTQAVDDPIPAAKYLLESWQQGRQSDSLDESLRPATLAAGYDMQDALLALSGDMVAGWKLGVGSPTAMRRAGLDRALVGRLLDRHVVKADPTAESPFSEPIIIAVPRPVTIEFEIAFILGRDIAPGAAPDDLMDAVESVHVGVELVLSRFKDRRTVGAPSFVADNVGFEAYLCGERIAPQDIAGVIASVEVQLDGVPTARGLHGDDAVDPLVAFGHLVDHARERGITLKRGEIVTTGAAAQPFDVIANDFVLTVRYLDSGFSAHIRSAHENKDKGSTQ